MYIARCLNVLTQFLAILATQPLALSLKDTVISDNFEVLFSRAAQGEKLALDQVFGVVYPALKKIARGYLFYESHNHTIQTTALVNEAYLKLAATQGLNWVDKKHFLTIAARAMRRILVDHARARNADKRCPESQRDFSPIDSLVIFTGTDPDLIRLDMALGALEKIQPRQAMVVDMRYFAGLSIEETAEGLNISAATAKRDWTVARLWLLNELVSG